MLGEWHVLPHYTITLAMQLYIGVCSGTAGEAQASNPAVLLRWFVFLLIDGVILNNEGLLLIKPMIVALVNSSVCAVCTLSTHCDATL